MDCSEFFQLFVNLSEQHKIPKENYAHVLMYVGKIFANLCEAQTGVTEIFVSSGGFRVFLKMTVDVEADTVAKVCALMVNTKDDSTHRCPNLVVLDHLRNLARGREVLRTHLYYIVVPFLTTSEQEIREVNEHFPVILWFNNYQRPFGELMHLMTSLSNNAPDLARTALPGMFKNLPNIDAYERIVGLIHSMRSRKIVDPSFLSECGYLDAFVMKVPSGILPFLFQTDFFEKDFLEVFSVCSIQPKCLVAMIQHDVNFIHCADCLLSSPTEDNIKALLCISAEKSVEKVCQVWLNVFMRSPSSCHTFIACNGLKWILERNISPNDMCLLLSSLVVFDRFPEIDEFIQSLPKEHPLFLLPKKEIETLVYGKNGAVYRPIRVVSLYHLLDESKRDSYVDPYNCYLLGNSNFPDDAYDCPLIDQIGNRYLQTHHVSRLLTRPYEIGMFCNREYDHFPIFQFYPVSEPLVFNIGRFRAISFWFKVHEECKTELFQADGIRIHIDRTSLVIGTEELEKVDIIGTSWNHLLVYDEISFTARHAIIVVNNTAVKVKIKSMKPYFTYAKFSAGSLLFLGAAIRFFTTPFSESKMLYERGPGFMDTLNQEPDSTVITPYRFESSLKATLKKPSGCYPVPYFGFPYHFISQKRLSDLFASLDNADTEENFRSTFLALLHINEITVTNSRMFWRKMICSLKNKRTAQFVNREILESALKSVSKLQKPRFLLATILFDNELWASFDNELLVTVLFDYFPEVAWSKIRGFDSFLATVILENPTSEVIIRKVLENVDKIPNLFKLILVIIGAAEPMLVGDLSWELIEARTEMPVQHTIIDSWMKFLDTPNSPFLRPSVLRSNLKFARLKGLLLVSRGPIAVKLFSLITKIETLSPNFMQVDEVFAIGMAPLSVYSTLWDQLNDMCTKHAKFLPLLLGAIFGASVAAVTSMTSDGILSEHYQKIEPRLNNGILLCIGKIQEIFVSKVCMFVVQFLFPFIFSSQDLFREKDDDKKGMKESCSDNIRFGLSEFSEAMDSVWSGRKELLQNSAPRKIPQIPKEQFLMRIIISIYASFRIEDLGFDGKGHDPRTWFRRTLLMDFLCELLFTCPKGKLSELGLSLLLSAKDDTGKLFAESIVQGYFEKVQTRQIQTVPEFLRVVSMCIKYGCFSGSREILLECLLKACEESEAFSKYSDQITDVMLGLFMVRGPGFSDPAVIRVLNKRSGAFGPMIVQTKSISAWSCILQHFLHVDKEGTSELLRKLSAFCVTPKDKMLLHEMDSARSSSHKPEIEMDYSARVAKYTKMTELGEAELRQRTTRFDIEIVKASKNTSTIKYYEDYKAYFGAMMFSKDVGFLDITFKLIEEKMMWSRFMSSIHEEMISLRYFRPKCYHLRPRCFPFFVPVVLSPSNFVPICMDRKKRIKAGRGDVGIRRRETLSIMRTATDVTPPNPERVIGGRVTSQVSALDLEIAPPDTKPSIPKDTDRTRSFGNLDEESCHLRAPPAKLKTEKEFSSDVIFLYKHHTLQRQIVSNNSQRPILDLFKNNYAEFGEPKVYESVELVRYHSVPCVLFVFDSMLLILTYAEVTDEMRLLDIVPSKELHVFLESIFIGNWGSTFLFASHIVIKIPIDMVIWARIHSPKAIAVWSFKNGHFLLRFNKSDKLRKVWSVLEGIVTKTASFLPSTVQFLIKDRSSIKNSSTNTQSVANYVLQMNGLSGKSFVDLENYPYIPRLGQPMTKKLTSILPFAYYNVPNTGNDVPVNFYYLPDFSSDLQLGTDKSPDVDRKKVTRVHTKCRVSLCVEDVRATSDSKHSSANFVEMLKFREDIENNPDEVIKWAQMKFGWQLPWSQIRASYHHICEPDTLLFCQKLTASVSADHSPAVAGDSVKTLPRLSARIRYDKNYYAIIEKAELCLTMVNMETGHRCGHVLRDHYFAFASSIYTSDNGLFLSIDYEFGLTRVYRIVYVSDVPDSVHLLSDFSWSGLCESVLSGVHWVCATARQVHVVVWDIVTGTVLRDFKPEPFTTVTAIDMDEASGVVWMATEKCGYVFNVNGHTITRIPLSQQITKIAVLRQPVSRVNRYAICGCEDGSLYIVSPCLNTKNVDIRQLPSEHKARITNIVIHPDNQSCITSSADGNTFIWSGWGLKPPNLKMSAYSGGCAVCCSSGAFSKCEKCGRPVCDSCLGGRGICALCRALSSCY